MVSAIAEVASEKKVNLFRRFELMKAWHKLEGISFDRWSIRRTQTAFTTATGRPDGWPMT